jgi:alkylation response protein AidB-like acyl-CoA dehydrogenase
MQDLFELDDTQTQLRDSLLRWLNQTVPFERRAALLASPEAIAPLWRGLSVELGLLGATLPEAAGGLGGGLADHLLILQALGGALLPEPYAAVLVGGAGLLAQLGGEPAHALLVGVVDGAVRPVLAALEPGCRGDLAQVTSSLRGQGAATVLSGRKAVVRAAPYATHWLVTARDEAGALRVALVNPGAAGTTRRDYQLTDGCWAAELAFAGTPVSAVLGEGDALAAVAQVADALTLATGAEGLGVMQRLMRDTIDYLRQRKQFKVPLASFQVLQHRLADMHMALLQAGALVGATLPAMTAPAAERRRAVASAQIMVARAARTVGQGAVQLHGGMGMTELLAIGHGFKRLTLIAGEGGGVDGQLRRVMAAAAAG